MTYRGESPQSKDMLDDVDHALEWASLALQSQAARLDTSPPAPAAQRPRTWRTQTAAKNARGIAKLELETAHFNDMCSKGMTTTLSVAPATQQVTTASPQSISLCPRSARNYFPQKSLEAPCTSDGSYTGVWSWVSVRVRVGVWVRERETRGQRGTVGR